ncbi:glycosyltransferase family 9 protein [Pendulispora brunnea]|uniref:Glycosyltransferase family 9 protein n=1 Tax=Pendulispora brunnea TaxID=2905690 RepID=A0ABZ2K801_9BACT
MFNVSLMRWIDDRVGNLACNALAYKKRLLSLLERSKNNGALPSFKKIAVMKFFGFGSIVVASPALAALRESFPDAEILFVTFKSNKDILEILRVADRALFIDTSSLQAFTTSTLQVAATLRREKVDLALDLEFFAKFPLVLANLAGIKQSAGYYLTQEHWRRTLLDIPGSYNHYFHTKDIFLSLVYLLRTGDLYYVGFDEFRKRYKYPQIEIRSQELERVQALLRENSVDGDIIVLNPNSSVDLAPEVRKWPEERYGELADRILAENPDAHVILIGAKSEEHYVNRVRSHARNGRVLSLAGKLSLRELTALFSIASLLVTNDSGPMHLACLTDTPIVGLFFGDTPTLFAPVASRVEVVAPSLYSIPMFTVYNGKDVFAGRPAETIANVPAQTVSVEDVMQKVRALLEPAQHSNGVDEDRPTVH